MLNNTNYPMITLFFSFEGSLVMLRYLIYPLLLIAALFGITPACAQTLQYENQAVASIEIIFPNECDETCDYTPITSRMKTRVGAPFSQIDFDNDLKMLVQEYDRVDPSLKSVDGKLVITLKIWPKPTIRSIAWEGNERIPTSKLQKELEISLCTVFDRLAFNKAFHKLKTYYVKKGFFEASLDYRVDIDPVTNSVDITIIIDEGRAGRIQKICFTNFSKEEEEEILDQMVTKKYCLFTSWYTEEGTYNEEMMQHDKFTIINYLQNEGYADAQIDIEICESKSENRIIINIIADRGEIYNFGDITFSGNKIFCDDDILAQIGTLEDNPFSPDALRDTVKRLTNFYGRRGYIDAVIDFETELDCECRTYSVNFTIEEGEQYRVGLIKVFGNCSTQTRVILHETLLIPGEIFNTIKLEVTADRLENIGYFKHVNVYAVRSEGPGGLGGHYRDVHIEVEETSTGNFSAGFGLSNAESIFGEFKITERNFNHEGLGCFCSEGMSVLRGGGEFLNLTAMIGYKSRKYTLAWTKPFFRDTKWLVGFEISQSNNRYISSDYEINAAGITFHAAYPLNPFLRFGTHYRLTYTDIDLNEHHIDHHANHLHEEEIEDLAKGDKKGAEKKHHEEQNISCKLREEADNSGIISAIGISLNYDSTDHPAFPRRGFKSKLEQELAGFGGHQSFMALGYLNKYFIPAGELGVIKLRADMRFIVPLFDTKRFHIPIEERLFLGGDSTIRGYKVYKLGPQYGPNDPRGGMSLQLLSAEYYRTFNKRFDAFVFCDSGHLSFDVWEFGTMWTSVGFGVNLRLIDGTPPIVLGLGFPLNPPKKSVVKNFFFSLGGTF